MTVEELIRELLQLPPKARVVVQPEGYPVLGRQEIKMIGVEQINPLTMNEWKMVVLRCRGMTEQR